MSAEKFEGGELVFMGGTDWAKLGRSGGKGKKTDKDIQEEQARLEKYPNLITPNRIKSLMGVRISFIAAGSTACHCIAVDVEGQCFTWGRNEKGQLGHGDTLLRNVPTVVAGLSNKKIISGAGGKFHTLVVTADGESFGFGSNLQGQLGLGSMKSKHGNEELMTSPVKALVEKCSAVSCGNEFSMWLCDGQLWAAGYPQHGALGDGSDHEYNAKDSSVQLKYDPQPTPKLISIPGEVTKVVCGQYHTLALDKAGKCYSWGDGGYGKLGHKVQKPAFKPTEIETFKGRMAIPDNAVIAAGSTSSFATAIGGQLFAWGKLKTSGDSTMYPQPLHDLSGWNLRSISAGPSTFAVAADNSVITWGAATNGELGYGPNGKKSSANPDKCPALDGMFCHQVACGIGFTMALMAPDSKGLEELPVFESTAEDCEEVEEVEEVAPVGKGKGGKGAAGKGKGAAAGKGGAKGAASKAAAGKRKAPEAAPAKGKKSAKR